MTSVIKLNLIGEMECIGQEWGDHVNLVQQNFDPLLSKRNLMLHFNAILIQLYLLEEFQQNLKIHAHIFNNLHMHDGFSGPHRWGSFMCSEVIFLTG